MSGLRSKPKEQLKECGCACNGLVIEMLQAMTVQSKIIESQGKQITALISVHASQNELLCKIVDGYRKWLKRICDLRSVVGSVKNSENSINRVDVVISSPCETLHNVMELCYKGPQHARVKKICFTQEYTNTKFEEFLIIN